MADFPFTYVKAVRAEGEAPLWGGVLSCAMELASMNTLEHNACKVYAWVPSTKLPEETVVQYIELLNEIGFRITYLGKETSKNPLIPRCRNFYKFSWLGSDAEFPRMSLAYLTVIRYLYFPEYSELIPTFFKLVKSKKRESKWKLFIVAHMKCNLKKLYKAKAVTETDFNKNLANLENIWWARYTLFRFSTHHAIRVRHLSDSFETFKDVMKNKNSINSATCLQPLATGAPIKKYKESTNNFELVTKLKKASDKELLTLFDIYNEQ